jgi:hypothetical protein
MRHDVSRNRTTRRRTASAENRAFSTDADIVEPSDWPTDAERGVAMGWLLTLAILVALVHFELWPLAGFWLCFMIATSLTTPET